MDSKTEGTMAIIAALVVLFSALLSPPLSAGISIVLLGAFGAYKFLQKR